MSDILTTAVDRNHLAWVRFCLENGADPNLTLCLDIYSPLAHAARYASVNVVSSLLKYDAELNGRGALALTAQDGKPNEVKFLLRKGVFVNEN